jgi:spore coat polysaccharide biosynthesis protein SpsF (cytidylyltransferase family)
MKLGALIPARLASERLPGKALLPLGGRPVIGRLLDRLIGSRHLTQDAVVVCTTQEESDDPLVELVESAGARVFRGSRDDIIDRFYGAIREFGFDAVAEVDGDDPFVDVDYMDLCLDRLIAEPTLDVVVTDGLPLGMGSKALRSTAVDLIWRHHRSTHNDTGFMYYFTRSSLCRVGKLCPLTPAHEHADARVTLDYPEDLQFFEAVWEELSPLNARFGVEELVALLRAQPELVAINAGRTSEYWSRTREKTSLEYELEGRIHKVEV